MNHTEMKKLALFILSVFFISSVFTSNTYAKRLLPRAKPASGGAGKVSMGTRGVTTSVKFRGDRRAIVVTFSNLGIASSVTYSLNYTTKGISQGAGGSLNPTDSSSVTRELLFGTCSHGVCRYDTGITNAKFQVITTLKNKKKVIKNFRLKV